jgi:hypothetical protein
MREHSVIKPPRSGRPQRWRSPRTRRTRALGTGGSRRTKRRTHRRAPPNLRAGASGTPAGGEGLSPGRRGTTPSCSGVAMRVSTYALAPFVAGHDGVPRGTLTDRIVPRCSDAAVGVAFSGPPTDEARACTQRALPNIDFFSTRESAGMPRLNAGLPYKKIIVAPWGAKRSPSSRELDPPWSQRICRAAEESPAVRGAGSGSDDFMPRFAACRWPRRSPA